MIAILGLSKRFGKKVVLDGLELTVPKGKNTVVIGGSGTGKSVLIKCAVGLLRPDAGEIRIDGQDIIRMDERELVRVRRRFGMLFQGSALFDSMDVGENVAFSLVEGNGQDPTVVAARVGELLARVGLPGSEGLWPADLSGGMRKRVAIARGLALRPEVVLYDEPTAGLDPLTGLAITRLIHEVRDETGATSVVVTHDLTLARELGGRIAFLEEGQFGFVGDLQNAATDPGPVGEFVRAGGVHAGT